MTDLDLERLGDVWRQQPDPQELEALKRSAEQVSRQARRAQFLDSGLAIVVSAVLLVLAISHPEPATLLLGGAAIVFMLTSTVRQRKLRELEVKSLTGTAEEMLQQAVSSAEATLKRQRFGLITSPPAVLLGFAFAATLDEGLERFLDKLRGEALGSVLIAVLLLMMSLIGYAYLVRQMNQTKKQLERLRALRDSFRHERQRGDGLVPEDDR